MASSGSKATAGEVLCDDLRHIQGYLTGQKKRISQDKFEKLMSNQMAAWIKRIEETELSPQEAVAVGELLSEGPWLDEHHESFATAMSLKMEGLAAGKRKVSKRPSQELAVFANYLTEKDVLFLSDPDEHNINKVQRLVDKCFDLGLHLPSENCIKGIIKTAIDCGLQAKDGPAELKQVQDFKTQLRKKIKHIEKRQLITTFPDKPEGLPKTLFDKVYNDDLPSPPKTAGQSSGSVVARKSHKSVKGKLFDENSMGGMMQFLTSNPNMNQMGVNPMMLMMAGMQQMMQQQGDTSGMFGGNAGLKIYPNKKKAAKALTDGKGTDSQGTDSQDSQGLFLQLEDGQEESPMEDEGQVEQKESPPSENKNTPAEKKQVFHLPEPEKPSRSPGDYVKIFKDSVKKRERSRAEALKEDKAEDDDQVSTKKRPRNTSDEDALKETKKKKENANADCKPETKSKQKAKPKEKAAGKKTSDDEKDDSEPKTKPKKKAAPKKAPAQPKERKDLGPKPNPPEPWNGTFFWGSGKIHKNPSAACWRVFIKCGDRKDKKVKLGDDHTASFHRALELIEEGMAERDL